MPVTDSLISTAFTSAEKECDDGKYPRQERRDWNEAILSER